MLSRWVGRWVFFSLFRKNSLGVVLEVLVLLGFGSSVVVVEVFILEEWFSMFCVWR